MKTLLHPHRLRFPLALLLLFTVISVSAATDPETFTVDQLTYKEVTLNSQKFYEVQMPTTELVGDIVVPETVTHGGVTLNVIHVLNFPSDAYMTSNVTGISQPQITSLTFHDRKGLELAYAKDDPTAVQHYLRNINSYDLCPNLKSISFDGDVPYCYREYDEYYLAGNYFTYEGAIYYVNTLHDLINTEYVPKGYSGELRLPTCRNDANQVSPTYLHYAQILGRTKITSIDFGESWRLERSSSSPYFGSLKNITELKATGNPNMESIDGILYTKNSTAPETYTLYLAPGAPRETLHIGADVTSIASAALAGCEINEVVITNPALSIPKEDAFAGFTGTIYFKGDFTTSNLSDNVRTYWLDFLKRLYKANHNVQIRTDHINFDNFKSVWKGALIDADDPYYITVLTTAFVDAVDFKVKSSADPDLINLKSVSVDGRTITPNDNKIYTATDLLPKRNYPVSITYTDSDGNEQTALSSIKTTDKVTGDRYELTVKQGGISLYVQLKSGGDIADDMMKNYEFGVCLGNTFYPATYDSNKKMGYVEITGLFPGTTYYPRYYVRKKGIAADDPNYRCSILDVWAIITDKPKISLRYNATQTTITILRDETYYDSTFKPDSVLVYGKPLEGYKMTDIYPGSKCRVSVTYYKGKSSGYAYVDISTYQLPRWNVKYTATPTTLTVTPDVELGDMEIESLTIIHPTSSEPIVVNPGEPIVFTGLSPNTSYSIQMQAKLKKSLDKYGKALDSPYAEGTYPHSARYDKYPGDNPTNFKLKTSTLVLTTLPPRNVSATASIVAAETNINECETNVGFQWRKYNAPSTLPSSEGKAAIHGGMIEGRIKNLQSTSYYNVRAYYEAANGTRHYSEWMTFDPSDFSYFEPTVATYMAENVNYNSARVRGYVLQGTDDITSQGFEYYPLNAPEKARRVAAAESGEKSVVLAKGQVMEALLEELRSGTTYAVRAFAETAQGTVYGDEIQFTTEVFNGIEAPDTSAAVPVAWFDASGRRFNAPQPGFNIVLYSDGTTAKVLHTR